MCASSAWSVDVVVVTVTVGAATSAVKVVKDMTAAYSLSVGGFVYRAEHWDKRKSCTSSIRPISLFLDRILQIEFEEKKTSECPPLS